MPYTIRDSRNNVIQVIEDTALTTTDYGVQIPGKNYAGYGDPIVQTLFHILENFACPNNGADAPLPVNPVVSLTSPQTGQLWFDTTNGKLRVYNGSVWEVSSGAAEVSATPPAGPSEGDLWYNTTSKQLQVYDGTEWDLVGPEFANTDNTFSTSIKVNAGGTGGAGSGDGTAPSGGTTYDAFGVFVNNNLVSVATTTQINSPTYYYMELNDGSGNVRYYSFSSFDGLLEDGLNIATSDFFNGRAKIADTSDALNGEAATSFMRNDDSVAGDLSRRPAAGTLDIGNASFRWRTMYADTFNGVSTSAQWADLAEKYEADFPMDEGTVVKIGGAKEITTTKERHDEDVFGVISISPAFKMNSEAGTSVTHPYVALAGRVPVKVIGTVRKGDRLASSFLEGVAEVISKEDARANNLVIIGRALEDKLTEEIGLVEVAITGAK